MTVDVGILNLFASHGWDGMSDGRVYREEAELALMAEPLGFDVVWAVEHHYYDYSFCPDNTVWLASIAARTSSIDVGTAAVIMPWNDPLRVAEKIAMLDHIADGRVRFGMGRGLSRREYEHFRGVDMEQSRARFDEAAAMVLEALETGWIEGDGPYYPQARTPIRPAPERTFVGRTYAVATSDDSIEAAARLGATMVMFADRSWEGRLPSIERWRAIFREAHDREPPPPLICDFVYCCADEGRAAEKGPIHLATYLESILEHYELMGRHFEGLRGHAAYASAAEVLRRVGEAGFLDGYLAATAHGTPEQILETYRARWDLIGPFEAAPAFRFGGIPFDEAAEGMRLFAEEVVPVLKTWD